MVCSLHSVTTGSRDRANVSLIIIIIIVRICPSERFCRVQNLLTSSVELIWPITELYFRQILSTDFLNGFYQDVKTGPYFRPVVM